MRKYLPVTCHSKHCSLPNNVSRKANLSQPNKNIIYNLRVVVIEIQLQLRTLKCICTSREFPSDAYPLARVEELIEILGGAIS